MTISSSEYGTKFLAALGAANTPPLATTLAARLLRFTREDEIAPFEEAEQSRSSYQVLYLNKFSLSLSTP